MKKAAVLLMMLGTAGNLWGQTPTSIGDEFQVNTYTTQQQYRPSVSVDADGDFVVAWESEISTGTDTSGFSIAAQRYASDGSLIGGEFQVNVFTTGQQRLPSTATVGDDGFVVVWESDEPINPDIRGRLFASDGSPVGDEFQVNTYTTSLQNRPAVASDADGDFVVVWESFGSTGTDPLTLSIQGRRYDSGGDPLGDQFQINVYTTYGQWEPSVALDDDGDFVVAWHSEGSTGTDSDLRSVQGRRYRSDGSPAGGEFQVNVYTTGYQFEPAAAMGADGGFVVVWRSYDPPGPGPSDDDSIQGRRYGSDGNPLGDQFQISNDTSDNPEQPSVALDSRENFVFLWKEADAPDSIVQGRRYASDGLPLGDPFQVNTSVETPHGRPEAVVGDNNVLITVWQSADSTNPDIDSNVQGRRFSLAGIFADGFESGDTSRWSNTVP